LVDLNRDQQGYVVEQATARGGAIDMTYGPAIIILALTVAAPAVAQPAAAGQPNAPAAFPTATSAVTPLLVLPNNPTRAVALAIIDGKPYVCHLADITDDRKAGVCTAMVVK
jgi:hypothetical protein